MTVSCATCVMCVNVSWGRPVGLCLRMLSASVRQGKEKGLTSLTYVSDSQAKLLGVATRECVRKIYGLSAIYR